MKITHSHAQLLNYFVCVYVYKRLGDYSNKEPERSHVTGNGKEVESKAQRKKWEEFGEETNFA